MYIDKKLQEQVSQAGGVLDSQEPMIAGQPLPHLNVQDASADSLFGFDGFGVRVETREHPKRRVYLEFEAFDPTKHVRGDEASSGNHGKNRSFRDENKKRS